VVAIANVGGLAYVANKNAWVRSDTASPAPMPNTCLLCCLLGCVIDWVDMGIGQTRWYTFNVADASISTAIVLLLVLGLFGERFAPRAESEEGKAAAPASEPTTAGTERPR